MDRVWVLSLINFIVSILLSVQRYPVVCAENRRFVYIGWTVRDIVHVGVILYTILFGVRRLLVLRKFRHGSALTFLKIGFFWRTICDEFVIAVGDSFGILRCDLF